jgi:hypothetical protein
VRLVFTTTPCLAALLVGSPQHGILSARFQDCTSLRGNTDVDVYR